MLMHILQAHDKTLEGKNYTELLLEAVYNHKDEASLKYYDVKFVDRHTGVTVRPAEKEGDTLWVVVDVRPRSEVSLIPFRE